MLFKKFISPGCQSLTMKAFTTSKALGKFQDYGVQTATNRSRPSLLLSCCFELSTLLNNKENQLSHCALTHGGHQNKTKRLSHCARWPLSQMTRCGHKPNELSHCAWWPLRPMTRRGHKPNELSHCAWWPLSPMTRRGHKPNELSHSARWPLRPMTRRGHKPNELNVCAWWRLSQLKSRMNIGLISVRCSSRVHVEALTSCYSCEKSENKINVHITTISENTIDHKRRVSRQRKRDREPSRISVKRILKGLKKRKCRKIIQSFVRRHLPKSSLICDLCKNYKTWNMWYTTDHFYCKFVFFMKSKKKCCKEHKHVQIVMNSNVVSFSQNHSRLMGGMTPENAVNPDIPWNCLTERLRLIGLIPHDVGGSGDCFFKSVSHQLYGTADLHLEIRMAGISHLQKY